MISKKHQPKRKSLREFLKSEEESIRIKAIITLMVLMIVILMMMTVSMRLLIHQALISALIQDVLEFNLLVKKKRLRKAIKKMNLKSYLA